MPALSIPTKEEAVARFWELKAAIDAVEAEAAPLREARDAHVNEAAAKDKELMAEMRALDEDVIDGLSMYEAKMQLSACAKLAGNVGADPAKAEAAAVAERV